MDTFTPSELAERWKIHEDNVRLLITSGELDGINVAQKNAKRPTYRVHKSAVEAFELKRRTNHEDEAPRRVTRERTQKPKVYRFVV